MLLVIFRSFGYGPKNKVPYREKFFLSVSIQNDLNLKDAFSESLFGLFL